MAALPRPGLSALAGQWSAQPIALAAVVALTGWYLIAAHRLGGWPARRTVAFLAGIIMLAWTTCGFPQAYARSLYLVWTAQTLALLLLIPVVLMAGQPLVLARRRSGHGWAARISRSRPARIAANPLVGPAAVLVLSAVLFFGPLPGWAVGVPVFGWILQLTLVAIGAAIALPLVTTDDDTHGSLAIGLALAIGMVELILDAIPGIVLRLSTHTTTSYFTHRRNWPWSPHPLHDQQLAGAVLWCVAEAIDLPFLALLFRRWVRADRAEAAQVDAVLTAEQAARAGLEDPIQHATADGATLWWHTDPNLRDRFRR